MKIAVMADIHSNHIALETCISKAKSLNVDEFIFLGDYVGELAYPKKTMTLLKNLSKEFPCTFIRGNKEDYWLNQKESKNDIQWRYNSSSTGMLKYAYDNLDLEDLNFFKSLPISKRMEYKNMPAFTICHGSPFFANQSLRKDYDYIDELSKKLETNLTICAHFHIQMDYTRNGKRIINPGSIGVPLESDGKTQFMILYDKDGSWDIEFISLEYDKELVIKEMDEEELFLKAPCWYKMAKAVILGKNIRQTTILNRAYELYKMEDPNADIRDIKEKYWEIALKEFNL